MQVSLLMKAKSVTVLYWKREWEKMVIVGKIETVLCWKGHFPQMWLLEVRGILFYLFILLLLWHYNSDRVLAFLTISFHLRQSCTCCAQFISFIFFRSFLTSSFHRDLGLPAGLPVNGFHLCILFIVLVWGILFMCRN